MKSLMCSIWSGGGYPVPGLAGGTAQQSTKNGYNRKASLFKKQTKVS